MSQGFTQQLSINLQYDQIIAGAGGAFPACPFKGIFMRRSAIAALTLLASFAISAPSFAYDIDPLTGLSVAPVEDGRAKATPITRTEVDFGGPYRPGTIVVDTAERRLYLVLDDNRAMRYGIGVGRPGFEWSGTKTITRKSEWPDWRPPAQMRKRRPDLPAFMPGGPQNPLGARAMYLGSSLYRIHGSNEPETIGQAVSSGCIRMMNDDVIDLYERVRVGTRVIVTR
jgi:lipoprotein-anchoring transpeptidase ErfK/SrfK